MQKKTPDYDNVFKTMKMKHKRLFVSVINDIFNKDYPVDVKVEVLPTSWQAGAESQEGTNDKTTNQRPITSNSLPLLHLMS